MTYFLSLGSNLGEREQTLERAVEMMEQQIGHVPCRSSFYYSEPWGFASEHPFCNICCRLETTMQPMEVLTATQAIEQQLGRNHKSDPNAPDYQDRIIDIDIIRAFDNEHNEIYTTGTTLTLPHPLWQEREFVKVPLNEIMKTYALVTGASSGMGVEFAKQLAARGYNLLIVSNEEAIHDRAKEIGEAYPTLSVIGLVMDLGKQTAARELFEYTQAHGIEVEVLVNNAGVYHDKDILDDSEGFTSLIMNLHMYTPAMLCYLFGQEMRTRRKGYILNVCSVTSKMAAQRLGTYGGTKAFLAHFTRALHIELRKYGVHVTNVSPGAVDTGLYSISPVMTKIGKCLGIIVSPQTLARRGLRALFWGCSKTTVPTIFWQVLCFIILLIPTCVLRLIRRLGWF